MDCDQVLTNSHDNVPAVLPRRRALDGDTNYPIVACFPFLLAASLVSLYGEKLAYALLQQVRLARLPRSNVFF